MATPTYNIPGQTSTLGARGPAAGIAAESGEPPPRTVAAVLARSHAGDVTESDIRASRVFELATHAPGQPGGKE